MTRTAGIEAPAVVTDSHHDAVRGLVQTHVHTSCRRMLGHVDDRLLGDAVERDARVERRFGMHVAMELVG
jgi:hypothetical protein